MGLYQYPKGSNSGSNWYMIFSRNGKMVQKSTRTDNFEEAQKQWKELEAQLQAEDARARGLTNWFAEEPPPGYLELQASSELQNDTPKQALMAPSSGTLTRITDLQPIRGYWDVERAKATAAEMDRTVFCPKGFTRGEWDENVIRLFESAAACMLGFLREMQEARSQMAWEIFSHEAIHYVNFIDGGVLPFAMAVPESSKYHGVCPSDYWKRVMQHIRQRVVAGPLG